MSDILERLLDEACRKFSEGYAEYPGGKAKTPISEWFELDAQDAVDFGVMKEPKWSAHSDIRSDEYRDYIAAVIREPMRSALRAALVEERKRALESAAVEAEAVLGSFGLKHTGRRVSAAIRSLMEKPE